jgi:hypothetical protein
MYETLLSSQRTGRWLITSIGEMSPAITQTPFSPLRTALTTSFTPRRTDFVLDAVDPSTRVGGAMNQLWQLPREHARRRRHRHSLSLNAARSVKGATVALGNVNRCCAVKGTHRS